jgi:hypothetical protein
MRRNRRAVAQWGQASTRRRLPRSKEKGVLSGKRVERRESGSPGEFADLENMTAEQLTDFIRKQAEGSLH